MITEFEIYSPGYGEERFGTIFISSIIPPKKEIPETFFEEENSWNQLATSWFKDGLNKNIRFTPKSTIKKDIAIRHLECLSNSRWVISDSKYLIAGMAFLLNLWFQSVTV